MAYRRQKRWWNAYILIYERVDDFEGEKLITKAIQDLTIGTLMKDPLKYTLLAGNDTSDRFQIFYNWSLMYYFVYILYAPHMNNKGVLTPRCIYMGQYHVIHLQYIFITSSDK